MLSILAWSRSSKVKKGDENSPGGGEIGVGVAATVDAA